jgi:hypothetical protein
LGASVEIRQDEPDEFAFQHSVLCQTALPASKPKADVLEWEKKQGRASLLLQAGKVLHPREGRWLQLGLPYGAKARLLLMHLNSEAVRSQSPIIPVEDSMSAFFRRLMGRSIDGREVTRLKGQLSALAAANFRMAIADGDRAMQMNGPVVTAFDLWFPTDPHQRVLWPSVLRLSADYFNSLTRYAVPLDERSVAALAHSALALDVYCWLAQRLHRIPAGKAQLVPWANLHEQFGSEYGRIRDFRRDYLNTLRQVKAVYSEARIESDQRGLHLRQSPPPVRKPLVALPGNKTIDLSSNEK